MSQNIEDLSDLPQETKHNYIVQRLRVRRRMAVVAFIQLVGLGAVLILGGVIIPPWAVRIDHMSTFLGIYFGALATIVMAYWSLGTYEHGGSVTGAFNSLTKDPQSTP
jgi:hypothetical protein